MERILTVKDKYYGEAELDVDRIIALVPKKNILLFERAYWQLNQEDFDRVSKAWHELKENKNINK